MGAEPPIATGLQPRATILRVDYGCGQRHPLPSRITAGKARSIVAVILFGGMIIGFAVLGVWLASAANEAKLKAKHSYEDSLNALKLAPANADLKQQTLRLGRGYSELTRDGKGVAIFDEVALMNDLNAVCAGAAAASVPTATATVSEEPGIQKKMTELRQLYNSGLVSDSEYTVLRTELLSKFTASQS
jgi:hypothetical protein